jgi:hypothetical protein
MSKHGGNGRQGTESKHRRHRQTTANRRSERGLGFGWSRRASERGKGESESINVRRERQCRVPKLRESGGAVRRAACNTPSVTMAMAPLCTNDCHHMWKKLKEKSIRILETMY